MPGLFNSFELSLLDFLFGNAVFTNPPIYYLAASTTTPNEDGTGITEPAGLGYTRVTLTNNTANFLTPAVLNVDIAEKKNYAVFTFPTASGGGWGILAHWIFFDALTAGNPLIFGTLSPPKDIDDNDTLRIPLQGMLITLD